MFDKTDLEKTIADKRRDVDGDNLVDFVGDMRDGSSLADILEAFDIKPEPGDETRATNLRLRRNGSDPRPIDVTRLRVMIIGAIGSYQRVEAA